MIKIKYIANEEKQAIVRKILQGKLKKKEARQILSCSRQTLYRYLLHARERGIESIVDNRHGNNRKLTGKQEKKLVDIKEEGRWRSARKALELAGVTIIKPRQVQRTWYHCLFHWGLPKKMLQDKGSQYKANARYTQTSEYAQSTFQFYAKALGIDLVFAHRAQTKGKIEKFWRFVQQDFARENMKVKSFDELNKAFFKWQMQSINRKR